MKLLVATNSARETRMLGAEPRDAANDSHARLTEAMRGGVGPEVYDALNACPDAECMECAQIVCRHSDPLHFHHDGCPSCAKVTA